MSTDNPRSEFIAAFDKLFEFVARRAAQSAVAKSYVDAEDALSDWEAERLERYNAACKIKGITHQAMRRLQDLDRQLFGPAGLFRDDASPLCEASFAEWSKRPEDDRLVKPFGGEE